MQLNIQLQLPTEPLQNLCFNVLLLSAFSILACFLIAQELQGLAFVRLYNRVCIVVYILFVAYSHLAASGFFHNTFASNNTHSIHPSYFLNVDNFNKNIRYDFFENAIKMKLALFILVFQNIDYQQLTL